MQKEKTFDNNCVNKKYLQYKQEFVILELPMNVKLTFLELKTARINMIKKFHPDAYTGDKVVANLMTSKINNAYDVLLKIIE